jgi:hypothetical protein
MDRLPEERLAANEAFFRDLNERIREAVGKHGADGHLYEFVCECADPGCIERLTMTVTEYEEIRADPARFVLAPGHNDKKIEIVLERRADHVVVQKVGRAAEVVKALARRTA